MKIFFLLSIGIIAILFIGKKVFYSAKRNLFKDQAAWSGKDIKIKHNKRGDFSASNRNNNYLQLIADESKVYLEEEDKKKND